MVERGWILAGTLLLSILATCIAQNSTCREAMTCGECIAHGAMCAWCAQDGFSDAGHSRCDVVASLTELNCTNIENPVASDINITKNANLSNAGDAALGEAIQVQPQEVHLKLRRGETASIELKVRQAEDYPVDLYYLMDLSESMDNDLQILRGIANDLVDTMKGLTRNFRVGFGSFVDKLVTPFVNLTTTGEFILTKCLPNCEAPYAYRNALPLTNNTDLFQTTLDGSTYSTSSDRPEGGFDALLQVAACKDEVGWRENARHLVVFCTDDAYHTAGDAKLGGIVTPNDGNCHVDPTTGMYNAPEPMDYPSLGQLSAKIQEQNIIPLFVVTNDRQSIYRAVVDFIPGAQIGILAENSQNIIGQIQRLYNEITSNVKLISHEPEELLVRYTSHCLNDVTTPDSNECSGLSIGDTVSFTVDVTAESCIEGGSTSFTVGPIGFNEVMKVNVEILCDCDCETTGTPNSEYCNGNGTLQCGQCACNPGRYGDKCQCSGDTTNAGDSSTCIAPNSVSVCSGRGQCVCGKCVCTPRMDPTQVVSGPYCQCDNFNCPLYDGQLCGGPQRGECMCDKATQQSKCFCTKDYEGDSCSCLKSQDACIAPNGLLCNAKGDCVCGACRCAASSPFKGPTCSDCATCSGQCENYQDCVQCKIFQTGPLTEEQCNSCNVEITPVKSFPPDVTYRYNCSVPQPDNCSVVFIPIFESDTSDVVTMIYVLENTVCPVGPPKPTVDVRWIAVGLAILIVVIGIVLIILYKLYIMYLDRKEFKEWEKEKANAKFSENLNPLYKPASTVHKNPAFGTSLDENDGAGPMPVKTAAVVEDMPELAEEKS